MNKIATGAIDLAGFGLDWKADKRPFFFKGNDGNQIESDYFALVRSDNDYVLGHCKSSYRPFQNETIFETMKKFSGDHGLEIERGGSLSNGKKVFFQMYIPKNVFIGKQEMKQYIFACNSFDHSCRLSFGYTNTVIVCQNTFKRALKDTSISVKHTQAGEAKIIELPSLFADHFKLMTETNEIFQTWESTTASKEMVKELIAYLTRTDAKMTDAQKKEMSTKSRNIYEALEMSMDKEIKEKGQSLWGLFNGVTYFTNHVKSHPKRENGDLESILIGTGAQMNDKAFDFIQKEFAA